jgi:hypothetical protein
MEHINHCEQRCDCPPPLPKNSLHNNQFRNGSRNNSHNYSQNHSHNNSHGNNPHNNSQTNHPNPSRCPHWCEKCGKCHKEPPPHKKNFFDGLDNEKLIMLVVLYMVFKSKNDKGKSPDNCENDGENGKKDGIDMKLLIALAYVFM